jgi:hypothetical protein
VSGESIRDTRESAFTPALRRLWRVDSRILAVVFVDPEGECVDYCSTLTPFEAKVAGAQMLVDVTDVTERLRTLEWGETIEVEVHAAGREIYARRVDDAYLLIVVVEAGGASIALTRAIERAVLEIRREADLETPAWDPLESLEVGLRDAVGWEYAPTSFELDGERVEVADVLGRFVDEEDAGLVCFRVRTAEGLELTLARDEIVDRWVVLKETGR